jgi:hypothetical protein
MLGGLAPPVHNGDRCFLASFTSSYPVKSFGELLIHPSFEEKNVPRNV